MRRALLTGLAAAASMLVAAPAASATETVCTGFVEGGTFDDVVVPENSSCLLASSVIHGDVTARRDSGLATVGTRIGGNVVGDGADKVEMTEGGFPGESVVGGSIMITGGGGPSGSAEPTPKVVICGTELPHGDIEVKQLRPSDRGPSSVLIGGRFFCGTPEIGGAGGGNTLGTGSIEVSDNTITGSLTVGGLDSGNELGAGSIEVKRNALGAGAGLFVEHNAVGGNLEVAQTTDPDFGPRITGNSGGGALECFDNISPQFFGSGNSFPKEEGQCD
jgi:hypothetical protein